MNTPIAILAGLTLIAGAIYMAGSGHMSGTAMAQSLESEWSILGHNEPLIISKLNRKNGELFACTFKDKACSKVEAK